MTYKLYVMTTEGGRWCTNALEYASVDEAETAGKDLFSRWMLMTDYAVVAGDSTESLEFDQMEARGILMRFRDPDKEEVTQHGNA